MAQLKINSIDDLIQVYKNQIKKSESESEHIDSYEDFALGKHLGIEQTYKRVIQNLEELKKVL